MIAPTQNNDSSAKSVSLIQSSISAFKVYLQINVLRMFAFGFAAGLPIMLVFSSLSFWLREAGAERSAIGFFSWVTLAYAAKWIWAPAVDKVTIPLLGKYLGRRKSWLLLTQISLVIGIVLMATTDPQDNLYMMAIAAVAVAFCSATQDIVIDAFRIESGEDRQQAAMAASYMIGYRLAMIAATAGVLYLTAMFETTLSNETNTAIGYNYFAWQNSYLIMAVLMGTMMLFTLTAAEPTPSITNSERSPLNTSSKKGVFHVWFTFKSLFLDPVIDLVSRYKSHAIILIVLISTYRISDIVMGVMANVFYVDMGFSKTEIASISKVFGVVMTLVGAFVAGGLINRYGILKILFVGGLLSATTNLLFVLLSQVGHNLTLLTLVISVDNLSAGIAMASLIAFMSSLTNKEFTATQYAWLSSAMLLLPKAVGGFSGVWLEALGYTTFFSMTAGLGIPALMCLGLLIRSKWHA